MVEVAVAYMPIVPSMKGLQKNLTRGMAPAAAAASGQVGQSMGSRLSSKLTSGLKLGAKVAGVGMAGILGTSLVKGFQRLSSIENAEAKLTGLGNSAQDTSKIMDNALAAVKGTAFGMDEAATTAASAVAAGVAPGKELEHYLGLVGDAATIAGTDMAGMGSIFNKVMTSGKVQGDVFAQLSDAGIPVVQMLADSMGIAADEVYDLGSKGKISSEEFLKAMSSMEGAALKGGETTTGAYKNMIAALSRFGAGLLKGVYPLIGPIFNKLTGWIDVATEKLTPLAEAVSEKLGNALRSGYHAAVRFITPLRDIGNDKVLTPDIVKRMGLSADSALGRGMTALIGGIRSFGAAWVAFDGDVTSSGFPGFMERAAFVIRSAWEGLLGGFRAFHASWNYFDGEVTSSGFAGFMEKAAFKLRSALEAVKGGFVAFGAAWVAFDGDVTSSGFAGFMERAAFGIRSVWESIKKIDFSSWDAFKSSLGDTGGEVGKAFTTIGGALSDLRPAMGEFLKSLPNLGGAAVSIVVGGLKLVAGVLSFLARHVDTIIKLMPAIVAGYVAWRVASMALAASSQRLQWVQAMMAPVLLANNALRLTNIVLENRQTKARIANTAATGTNTAATATNNAALGTGVLARGRAVIATVAHRVATVAASVATRAAAAAQWVFNAALSANPIGLVIAAVAALVAGLVWFFTKTKLGGQIWATVWGAIKAKVAGFVTWFQVMVLPVLSAALSAIGTAFRWLYTNIVLPVWTGIKIAIGAVVGWISATVVPWVRAALAVLGSVFRWLYTNVIVPVWAGIKVAVAAFATWFTSTAVPFIRAAIQVAGQWMRWLYTNVIVPVWSGIKGFIGLAWSVIRGYFNAIVWTLQNVVAPAMRWLYNSVIVPVWNAIKKFIGLAWAVIRGYFNAIKWVIDNVLAPVFRWLYHGVVRPMWEAIRSAIAREWNFIRDRVFNPIRAFISGPMASSWRWLKDMIAGVWSGIKNTSRSAWDWIRGSVFDPLKRGIGLVKDAFSKAQDGISKAWHKLRAAVKDPVKFVVTSVINPFIRGYNKINDFWKGADLAQIGGFARGGVLPGYQRSKRDDVLTPMRSGEGVLVPEVVRGIGGASTINALNAAGNAGGTGAVQKLWKSGNLDRPTSSENEKGMYAAGPRQAGPGTYLWGAIQTQMNRTGRLYVPRTRVLGADIAEAAKAWMGQSALDIIAGRGSPSVSAGVGHRGPWGFADTSGRLEISTTTPNDKKMGVAIHELGHILSLDHSGDGSYADASSVMSAGMRGGSWPHPVDYRVLRRVWGKPGDNVTRYSASDVEGVTANAIDPIAWIKDKLDKFITGPIKRAKERFAGNKFSQMPLGIAPKIFDGVKKKAADLAAPFLGVVDAGKKVVGGAVSQIKVRTWMNKALNMKGLLNPGNMASGVARAMKESGGDPNITQQIKDINSGGNEAQGLMQVVPTTFRAHAEPGHGNPFDPIDSILASINYTLKTYGSVRAGWDMPGGYARGGIVDQMWDDPVGAVHALRPGVSTVYNGTGTSEYFQRVAPAATTGPAAASGEQIASEAVDYLHRIATATEAGKTLDGQQLIKGLRSTKRSLRMKEAI